MKAGFYSLVQHIHMGFCSPQTFNPSFYVNEFGPVGEFNITLGIGNNGTTLRLQLDPLEMLRLFVFIGDALKSVTQGNPMLPEMLANFHHMMKDLLPPPLPLVKGQGNVIKG